MSAQLANPQYLTVKQLSAVVQDRRVSPVELMDAFLDCIERHDRRLHAFVTQYRNEARLAAEAADMAVRSGHSVGPLHGIPIALKDVVEIEGRVTTAGSKVWRERVSTTTATMALKAKAAGMVVIGKTHCVEFAMGGWGTNQHMGTPLNPWDPETPRKQ
jgi:aspartyl-tRNA(Asn)/glutamyl-tRNA(Gln) amidotransferase subunit A